MEIFLFTKTLLYRTECDSGGGGGYGAETTGSVALTKRLRGP